MTDLALDRPAGNLLAGIQERVGSEQVCELVVPLEIFPPREGLSTY
jgi:hypothetical protein